MRRKLATVCGAILIVVFVMWVVVNATVGMKAPDITSKTWLNREPIHPGDLKGKVVVVEFWTFGCYNCRNVEPSVKAWHETYAARDFDM